MSQKQALFVLFLAQLGDTSSTPEVATFVPRPTTTSTRGTTTITTPTTTTTPELIIDHFCCPTKTVTGPGPLAGVYHLSYTTYPDPSYYPEPCRHGTWHC